MIPLSIEELRRVTSLHRAALNGAAYLILAGFTAPTIVPLGDALDRSLEMEYVLRAWSLHLHVFFFKGLALNNGLPLWASAL